MTIHAVSFPKCPNKSIGSTAAKRSPSYFALWHEYQRKLMNEVIKSVTIILSEGREKAKKRKREKMVARIKCPQHLMRGLLTMVGAAQIIASQRTAINHAYLFTLCFTTNIIQCLLWTYGSLHFI